MFRVLSTYAGSYASSANPKDTHTRGGVGRLTPSFSTDRGVPRLPQWMTRCVNTTAEPVSAGTAVMC